MSSSRAGRKGGHHRSREKGDCPGRLPSGESRGRVGRAGRRGPAPFLTPPPRGGLARPKEKKGVELIPPPAPLSLC